MPVERRDVSLFGLARRVTRLQTGARANLNARDLITRKDGTVSNYFLDDLQVKNDDTVEVRRYVGGQRYVMKYSRDEINSAALHSRWKPIGRRVEYIWRP